MIHLIPALLLLAAGSLTVDAHTIAGAIDVNGEYQGYGIYPPRSSDEAGDAYIRGPSNNSPLKDVSSEMLTCNQEVTEEAPRYIDVEGGDEITIYWRQQFPEDASDGVVIPATHLGPLLLYIAPAAGNGKGDDWVKIDQTGFDGVANLLLSKSQKVILPDLASGQYLLRPELIAYHTVGEPQFYTECIQLNYVSNGQHTLPEGVAIPGAYSESEPAYSFNMYKENHDDYVPFGPDVYDFGSPIPSDASAETSISPATTVTYGGTESAETSISPATTVTYGGTESAGTSDSPATSVAIVPSTMSTAYISTAANVSSCALEQTTATYSTDSDLPVGTSSTFIVDKVQTTLLYATESDSPSAVIYDQAQATSAAGRWCHKSHHNKSHHRTA